MKDSVGTKIQLGSLLKSSLFIHDNDVQPMWVIKITDMIIVMSHTTAGSQPIILDQHALDNSFWIVVGFSKVEEKKSGEE